MLIGVPKEIISAIIGVETFYGKRQGNYRVLDSLSTLAFDYPKRSLFWRELKEFFVLSQEQGVNPGDLKGSYAGAMGYGQFIPSSYRAYAIDYDGDGKKDLWANKADAIGSVANYFIRNGWKPGQPVTSAAFKLVEPSIAELANRQRKVKYTARSLRDKGAAIRGGIDDNEKLNVLMLNANHIISDLNKSNRYVVRAGDTACRIAESVKVSCKSLFKLNKLNKKGDIYRGQVLKLPASAQKRSQKSSQKPSKPSNASKSNSDSSVQERYFFTHHNFYAITEYNHSVLYAMAVYELSNAIGNAKEQNN